VAVKKLEINYKTQNLELINKLKTIQRDMNSAGSDNRHNIAILNTCI